MRITPHQDQFAHGERECDLDRLRKHGPATRQTKLVPMRYVLPIVQHLPLRGPQQPCQQSNQGRFTCAVWADDEVQSRGLKTRGYAIDQHAMSGSEHKIGGGQHDSRQVIPALQQGKKDGNADDCGNDTDRQFGGAQTHARDQVGHAQKDAA